MKTEKNASPPVCDVCGELATMAVNDVYWYEKSGQKYSYPAPYGPRYGCDKHPVCPEDRGYRPL